MQWVSTDWLEAHLNDKNLMILNCPPNIHEYLQAHIPGAIYWSEGLLRAHDGNMPTRWDPPEIAQHLFRMLGLESDDSVVVYSISGPISTCSTFIGDGLEQTMIAYTPVWYGHGTELSLGRVLHAAFCPKMNLFFAGGSIMH